jgi:hypothetical protein
LEGERFQRILPIEYIAHAGDLELPLYCPNLSAAIYFNQLISSWVQSCILGCKEPKRRSEIKEYFIQTAVVTLTFSSNLAWLHVNDHLPGM